jgi:hypothetical protein
MDGGRTSFYRQSSQRNEPFSIVERTGVEPIGHADIKRTGEAKFHVKLLS